MIEEEDTLEWDEYGEGYDAMCDAAEEWWNDEINASHEAYAGILLDTGYGVDAPARMKFEGSAAAATLAQLHWYVHRISDLLEHPNDPGFDDERGAWEYGVPSCLELAQQLIADARRLLIAAGRRSSEVRALSWMLASLTRTATLAVQQQVALDYLTRGDSACSGHITHLTLTDTLESASHAPPLMEVIRTAGPAALPSMAGRLQPR